MKRVALLLLVAAFLTGCASTIQDRRKERLAAYSALPPEAQTLVDKGQVKVGMPKDAVYIAWGKPERIVQSESDQGRTETWIYYGSTLRPYHYWNHAYYGWGTFHQGWFYYAPMPYLETDFYPEYYVSREVTFRDERVVNWRTLQQPPY